MISPTNTVCPEWQNENVLRAYPLEDEAPAASAVPTWLISDLRLSVADTYSSVYISSVYLSDTIVSVGISGVTGNQPPVGLLTKTVTRDELTPYSAYTMDRISDGASGVISFGEIPDDAQPLKFTFGSADSRLLESTLVRTRAPGVTRIVDNAHGTSATGIIDLSGNDEFRTYLSSDATGKLIIVELTDLYKEMTTSVCSSAPSFSECGETPVKTINGVPPTAAGVITIKFR